MHSSSRYQRGTTPVVTRRGGYGGVDRHLPFRSGPVPGRIAGMVARLYPPTQPYEQGMLAVGDGNHVYWAASGNPHGVPALLIHGGPGNSSSAGARRYFDPDRYRIIQFDQ